MKRSQSCSSSSSSSEVLSPTIKMVKPKVKRARRSKNPVKCQNVESPGRRSSMFRGVTRHRWTGRFEAHLWDKNTWNQVQNKKGRQVYLGAYDEEEAAAHTYDLAALKYWGADTFLNFPFDTYVKEFEEMQNVSKEEYLATLRRRSSGFSRGVSKYRGVARHHHNGRWEARIGRVFGNKYLYLGTYGTQEEAATAYDLAAIEYRGTNAVTNFDISHYLKYPQPHPSLQHQQLLQALQLQHYQQKQQEEEEASPFIESHEMTPSISESQMLTPELPSSDDQLTVAVDHIEEEHPWSICMDSEFNSLPVLDIAIGKSNELLDLFEDTQFEENIDLFFGGGSKEYGINLDNVFENSGGFESSFLGGAIEEQGDESYPYPISICS